MKFYLKMAVRSCFKDKHKFTHNVVGIAVGIMLLILVTMMSMSFKNVLYDQMKISDDDIITIATGDRNDTLSYFYNSVFDEKTLELLKNEKNIVRYSGIKGINTSSINFVNDKNENKRFVKSFIYAADEGFTDMYGASVDEGVFCSKEDELTIGSNIADSYGIKVGDTIIVKQFDKKMNFKVSGILGKLGAMGYSNTPDMINNIVIMGLENPLVKDENYLSVVAQVSDTDILEEESEHLTELLNEDANMTQELKDIELDAIVVNNLSILDMIDGYFVYINIFIAFLFVIVSIIVIINFSNIMTITILSRSREIGIMKITGGSDAQISKFYSIECMFVGAVGTVIGITAGTFTNLAVTLILNWDFNFSLPIYAVTIIVGILSPTLAGMKTQKKIKKQTISDIFHN